MKLEVILQGETKMENKNYHVSKTKKKKEIMNLELNELDGYKVNPKVKSEDAIDVSRITFVDDDITERIIRKKVDKKIEYLLMVLKKIEEDGDETGDTIKNSLMDAEKLRIQLINNYIKYLGHTYHSLTLKKIELIIEELKYLLESKSNNNSNFNSIKDDSSSLK